MTIHRKWSTLLLAAACALGCGTQAFAREAKAKDTEEPPYAGYLFAYFEGRGEGKLQEQLRFAVSRDARDWYALNGNRPILASDTISESGGIRDPHILRGEDGKTFYIVATDMFTIKNGWGSNPGIVLLKSTDLIHWSHARINLSKAFPEHFGDAYWVWAPQTIYDREAGKYLVYFSILTSKPGDYDKVYYCYANEDFSSLSEPKILYDRGKSTIDGDIIYKDGVYHMFFKTEGDGNGIMIAKARNLTDQSWTTNNVYVDQNDNGVEGSGVYERLDGKGYILMYDVYTRG